MKVASALEELSVHLNCNITTQTGAWYFNIKSLHSPVLFYLILVYIGHNIELSVSALNAKSLYKLVLYY